MSISGCAKSTPAVVIPDDNYRTTYEIFVYSFCDSDGDGIGDLNGVTEKLDYIGDNDPKTTTDLGCNQIWLTPVFPSPTYHKYDATDYKNIDPQFGSLEDFDHLVQESHDRGIRVLLDLAVNHTSVQHPWFEEAAAYLQKKAADGNKLQITEADIESCPYLAYYNFAAAPSDGYAPLAGNDWYYEARFWEGMPDLNLDNEAVRSEIAEIAAFWLDRGVDGFRLDAVTSYYTEQAGKNIDFLSWLNDTVKAVKPDAYLVGECWTDQNTYAKYYESGVDSFFDFAFAGQDGIIANVVRGNKGAAYYAEAMQAEEALYREYNPDFVNAPFYTNHDMARSTGYYAYDDGTKTKLAGALNLLMTGNATIYYGEEIGMKGSGKDENKRAPMQWSDDAGAPGMCQGPPEMDAVAMKFDSLKQQQEDPTSVWNYYRQAIALRNRIPVLARGTTTVLTELSNRDVCVFSRQMEERANEAKPFVPALVVINPSKEVQTVDLTQTKYKTSRLEGSLLVGEDEMQLKDGVLTVPAGSIAVLQ